MLNDYEPHVWQDGQTITAERLNALEQQVAELTKAVKAKRRTKATKAEAKE